MAKQSRPSFAKTELLKEFNPLPKLVVFDLDYTLWPYWVDTHISLPIRKPKNGVVTDASGTKLRIYPEVVQVLETLKDNGILIAAASRTQEPPAARDMLKYFDLDKYFDFKEIYPGEKTAHFNKIKRDSNVAYEDMLFFDDESRNIVTISKLKVTCYFVKTEVSMKTLKEGLALFVKSHGA
ncbi:magnesium-dependent phosphatase 1-like isoform X1 [Macrosteles quadrilineatus]|uniref:magnesium-dependent phosphatase 1-like isoform X1 n=1 Tax=Macrosteles quadrilineatus TaxID=74068 RepID=UPI0023E12F87|nr:magnesium-dependent phosphatase 1-like isoform X1 [Macrosteles quadrilineatus]